MTTVSVGPETRLLRQRAHESFDRAWRQGRMSRTRAYLWLADRLGVPERETHMGRMTDHGLLRRVVEVSDEYVGTTVAQDDFPDDL